MAYFVKFKDDKKIEPTLLYCTAPTGSGKTLMLMGIGIEIRRRMEEIGAKKNMIPQLIIVVYDNYAKAQLLSTLQEKLDSYCDYSG